MLSFNSLADSVSGPRDVTMNKMDKCPCSHGAGILEGETDKKPEKKQIK